MWRVLLTTAFMKMQEFLCFVVLTYTLHCQQCNKYCKRWHGNTVTPSVYFCARNTVADSKKHTYASLYSVPYFCSVLNKFGVSQQIFIRISNFTKIRPVEAPLVGLYADKHEEANRRPSQLA